MAGRRYISLTVKLAAALVNLRDRNGAPLIPYADAKLMTAAQIISIFEWHHYPISHEAGGPDEPWNLMPLLIPAHRVETARKTIPARAKANRLTEAQKTFRDKVLARPCGAKREHTGRWPRRKIKGPMAPRKH